MGSMVGQGTVSNSSHSLEHLTPDASKIIMASLDPRTKAAYWRAWCRFSMYCSGNKVTQELPISSVLLINFLTSLHHLGYQPSTVASHVSAIAFIHKVLGLEDPTASFLVKQFLKGNKKLNGSAADLRLPITTGILQKIVSALPKTILLYSHRLLLKALFLLCYNAFLRMGEISIKSGYSGDKVIQRKDVSFSCKNGKIEGIIVTIRHFKNNIKQLPVTFFLPLNPENDECCPVRALQCYLSEFKHTSGALFQFQNGLPVTYSFVAEKLSVIIGFLGLDVNRYKPHSFRIGAATAAYFQGRC